MCQLLQVLVFFKPRIHILRIPHNPCSLCIDTVQALRKRHVEALCALVLEKGFNVLNVLTVREARRRDRHDGAEHAQTWGKPAL